MRAGWSAPHFTRLSSRFATPGCSGNRNGALSCLLEPRFRLSIATSAFEA